MSTLAYLVFVSYLEKRFKTFALECTLTDLLVLRAVRLYVLKIWYIRMLHLPQMMAVIGDIFIFLTFF
jgi:hypothetical protein